MDVDAKTVVSRLKKLRLSGVIQSYRININREKIGLMYYKIFIKLKKFDIAALSKIRLYLLSQNYVLHLIENSGYYEFEIEIEIPSSTMMHKFVKQLRNNHPEIIEKTLSTEIIEELKLTWLPK